MENRKKKNKLSMEELDEAFEESVDGLAEAVVEQLKERSINMLEPFDAYAEKMRSKIHTNNKEFRKRFVQGYQVLLKELAKESEHSGSQKEPPPEK
jgi:DNA-binding ferritin-like protein